MDLQHIRLGVLGGGQLGKMLAIAAHKWDVTTIIMDPNRNCPASKVTRWFEEGDFTDYDTVYNFGKKVDLLTIEIEKVNAEALLKLEKEGLTIHPSPKALMKIRDKGVQRTFLDESGIPGPVYRIVQHKDELIQLVEKGKIQLPFVQKITTGGYDGRGVHIVHTQNDLDDLLDGVSLVEEKIEINKEIAVIATRGINGEITCFQPVEMVFKEEANLLDYLMSPAAITQEQEMEAIRIAQNTIGAFDIYGLLAVEMFLTKDNRILVNEVAPRPHNSGHHTIEASVTSQYEQHLRAILGVSLGRVKQPQFALMANLLGEPEARGTTHYSGFIECVSKDGIHIHVYGKTQVSPYRKMGHVTIISSTLKEGLEKLKFVREHLKIIAKETLKKQQGT
jgi:5-(carboxyamino)imidazole ribonucleotide synthase